MLRPQEGTDSYLATRRRCVRRRGTPLWAARELPKQLILQEVFLERLAWGFGYCSQKPTWGVVKLDFCKAVIFQDGTERWEIAEGFLVCLCWNPFVKRVAKRGSATESIKTKERLGNGLLEMLWTLFSEVRRYETKLLLLSIKHQILGHGQACLVV